MCTASSVVVFFSFLGSFPFFFFFFYYQHEAATMRVTILVLALLAIATATLSEKEYQNEFTKWMKLYKKTHSSQEFSTRYSIWKANHARVQSHNADETKGFKLELNRFADLTGVEFKKVYLGLKPELHINDAPVISEAGAVDAPVSLDWRKSGAVTPVKNQGQCGSCWSFSTTGSTEGANFLKTKKLVSLSEQNLIDCSVSYGNQGCNGGLMTQAMQYIIDNKGLDTEASYPYTTSGPNDCQFDKSNVGGTLASFSNVATGNEKALLAAGVFGPVSVAIDASQYSFQLYSSGVYYEPECSSSQLDHGVLMIGWGTEEKKDFWWVKNSWGASWGINGYIKMSRNRSNNCGIATMATLPKA
eukprot:TRINITY_DN2352_c0_g1_i1.p2 TRINITY_DN2352_c0_g1~~TRINITY_DN2352_c0_g1_i1.p2  ORF type:complete len:359 (+),score=77.31 TRINITY_DN2352_c0_g1_i1:37-1113(+)